jgi:transposase-like protein
MRTSNTTDGRAAVLRALEQSGLSMAEFCRRQGLSYGTVALWRSQARKAGGRFIEVETSDTPAPERATHATLCAELTLPGGAVLRVYHRGAEGGAL